MLAPTIATIADTLGRAAAERLRTTAVAAATRSRRTRIGIDIRPFYEPLTGVGWYLYFLLHEFARHEGVDLYLFGDARVTDLGPRLHADVPANARLCTFDLRGKQISRLTRPLTAGAYVAWMQTIGCDVFFGANYFLPRLMSAVARRRVITIHDLTYKRYPGLLQKETLANLEAQMAREIAVADAIVCVSESTRRDVLRHYQVDPSRVVAIHSGVAAPPPPEPVAGLPRRYILFVGTVEPRKNLRTLLDAWARLRASGAYDGELVVVGRLGWESAEMARRLREPGVRHLDYLNAGQLSTVYRHADVFVFPSIYEGFGFPLLEAMAHGVPAIAARSSSLPEIGGEAALYFDPRDDAALARELRRVTEDAALREELIAKGRRRVQQFRWEEAAAKTLDVLRRVA
ncbi:MAG TPA: glycosyltransferase family 1 protein, partial [Thermoanaerobaculia bacterium]|nr:glycosyltransferase family 1 protein [Thermoanaerobaculia bacterium]